MFPPGLGFIYRHKLHFVEEQYQHLPRRYDLSLDVPVSACLHVSDVKNFYHHVCSIDEVSVVDVPLAPELIDYPWELFNLLPWGRRVGLPLLDLDSLVKPLLLLLMDEVSLEGIEVGDDVQLCFFLKPLRL